MIIFSMFVPGGSKSGKSAFLEEKAKNREDRVQHRKKVDQVVRIQKFTRGYLTRKKFRAEQKEKINNFMEDNSDWTNLSNKAIFIALRGFLFNFDKESDEILENICRCLTTNLLNPKGTTSTWYSALLCNKEYATLCVRQVRRLIQELFPL